VPLHVTSEPIVPISPIIPFRKTSQHLLPAIRPPAAAGQYDIYPAFSVGPGQIHLGFGALAERLATASQVVIDGYPGVLWEDFRTRLDLELHQVCLHPKFIDR